MIEVEEETEEEREAARQEKRRLRKLRVKAMVINHHIYF
ncbi:unnamed protein product [Plutella xylostella]|uniref:(diamondback moth) hypothetical protein n=1 Tax=Plutella xylostella TaxID=51655 RepID=A0A8S4FV54_PLUXY|nr:unnamed protein product [Plutella xylostella]